jgi:hypothetical protein
MTVLNPWFAGPEFDGWDSNDPVTKLAEAEAEDVMRGFLPRTADLLPQTQLILSAHDARVAAEAASEPEPEAGQ